jgi:hypothetical protein
VPLSEHEQRLLDQIERALYAEDPKFASTVRSTDLRTHMRRRLRRAAFLLGLGFVLLVAGLPAQQPIISVVGFVVMLAALLLALSAWKRLGGGSSSASLRSVGSTGGGGGADRALKRAKERGSARDRLEERWKRRWDERGR